MDTCINRSLLRKFPASRRFRSSTLSRTSAFRSSAGSLQRRDDALIGSHPSTVGTRCRPPDYVMQSSTHGWSAGQATLPSPRLQAIRRGNCPERITEQRRIEDSTRSVWLRALSSRSAGRGRQRRRSSRTRSGHWRSTLRVQAIAVPWVTEDAPRDSSNRLLDAGWTHYFPSEWTTITRCDIHGFHTLPKRNAPFRLEKVPRPGGNDPAPNWCRS